MMPPHLRRQALIFSLATRDRLPLCCRRVVFEYLVVPRVAAAPDIKAKLKRAAYEGDCNAMCRIVDGCSVSVDAVLGKGL